ncbi:hypothetical protein RhiirA5_462527 [Rhizophagus irregularis]|uniref:BTB domain-containing protein n=3 Tax=Rhizophagus irregularis TaxID=588596 RepID=A0A2N0RAX8_9GLOM|nr:BTB/POZ protein [Rhizophagus irregularis DAOM 181602=DAOM 197198]EXX73684.1 hypothetical protein RirG_058170 [Rhizophagus irregularis DAOM 197198w]PKC12757.1 hypothetical protein RhiirA5_462527 [Rhizophagus irregularis]PKC60458.1 hypothetical protein RhiirA1_490222 [Rhizophagus irregularis]POG61320.1 BTB/POZ protein [Rhizophagus irregularis DAOM 181602=DAOM 197198]UZO21731.1 hypothetical protein OCT59_014118 [Rhizophagus irregularis]|eukprot:XP_025168186.1 BTB/POZ protein [Rhizophagus irregularis DAOM 181602=DAOM 197198]
MSSQNKDERIVLNIGGIKYETYRSTLTAYPDTLLGTMFQERNEELLKPNKNEYFFDRNGKAFHYIMEYYRTGKIFWLEEENNNFITKQELRFELDFFQISYNLPNIYNISSSSPNSFLQRKSFPQINDLLKDFIESLKSCIYETAWNLKENLDISFYSYTNNNYKEFSNNNIEHIEYILKPFKTSGYKLLNKFKLEIEDELKNSIKELIKLEITHNPELISVIRRPPHYNLNFRIQNIL